MSDPATEPILHDPWQEPDRHWDLSVSGMGRAPGLTHGRRPSQPSRSLAGGEDPFGFLSGAEPYRTINEIREHVNRWRTGGYPGANTAGRRLLADWRDAALEQRDEVRAFFCQREAVETLAWLFDAIRSGDETATEVWERLRGINAEWNDGMPRVAVKMATGAGKTRAMAMLIAYLETLHPEGVEVVVISPNLTVDERLAELGLLIQEVARGRRTGGRARVTRLNFQRFRPRNETWDLVGGRPTKQQRKVLRTGDEEVETTAAMLDRLLGQDEGRPVYVLQDEGHHCRRPGDESSSSTDEDFDNEGQWYRSVQAIAASRDLHAVVDFSATPMYLRQPQGLTTPLFPWTVCDYPIEDAIEAGICKIPRLPVASGEQEVDRRLTRLYDVCREKGQRERWGTAPPPDVQELFRTLADDWESTRLKPYRRAGRTPAVIVVVDSVHNATVLYRWVAGHRDGNKPKRGAEDVRSWKRGAIRAFSNVDPETLRPKAVLPTLLVHSRIGEAEGDSNAEKALVDEQLELRAPGESKAGAREIIREIFQTVGEPGEPGEHIRCVISVAMLSEGWDAKTVTHVLGHRAFRSVLLCEQVIGRALRRPSLDDPRTPEYAEVFGVPFPGLRARGQEQPDPEPPRVSYIVKSRTENAGFRLAWPNVAQLRSTPPQGRRHRLDPKRVRSWKPDIPAPVSAEVQHEGGVGELHEVRVETGPMRPQSAVYDLATELSQRWSERMSSEGKQSEAEEPEAGVRRRGVLFADALVAVRSWLAHHNVDLAAESTHWVADRAWRNEAVEELLDSCVSGSGKGSTLAAVFLGDEDRSKPGTISTEGVQFETNLPERYQDCAKSELSDAACHSGPEVTIAAWLDRSSLVRSWARNFRLGWTIPWWDPASMSWRDYEPDFLVRLETEELRHVVVEMKGIENQASKAKERAARRWCEALTASDDSRCPGVWTYVLVTAPAELESRLRAIT